MNSKHNGMCQKKYITLWCNTLVYLISKDCLMVFLDFENNQTLVRAGSRRCSRPQHYHGSGKSIKCILQNLQVLKITNSHSYQIFILFRLPLFRMKKKTGISKLLDVSEELAKIIGTKKGQRVIFSYLPINRGKIRFAGVQATGGEEAVRLHQHKQSQGIGCCVVYWEIYHAGQDPESKAYFTPDKTMQPVFGSSKQRHFGMTKHLKGHLTDPKK